MFTKLKKYDKFIKNPVKIKRSVRIVSNFRNIKAKIYITNKIIKKSRGWGAFCTNRIAQKCLSVALILALAVGMVPSKKAQAQLAGEPTTFVTSAYANHWGRSDLRVYLNNGLGTVAEDGTVSNKNYKLDSTADSDNTSGYAKQFSDAEFALVQPFTYVTNVLDGSANATAVYETTDRFWLPSGNNHKSTHVASWGSEDMSTDTQYSKSTAVDMSRIIPQPYWPNGISGYCWFRPPSFEQSHIALLTKFGFCVFAWYVTGPNSVAAACKINMESIIFASAASAKDIVGNSDSGAKRIEICGMYLKTVSDKTFTANTLTLSGNNLTVGYTGGEAGQYVVVQAFNEDILTAGTTSYEAAKQLEAGQTSATIDVTNWGVDSLNGYTVKVWMEDGTGSLARATIPETFVCINGVFVKTTDGAVQNDRVFSEKSGLQCSWGTIENVTNLNGKNATDQKIIFGGMEYWIAGRETAANGGKIDPNGNIMTLYQAKVVETKKFNSSSDAYSIDSRPAVTLQLTQDQISEIYDGTKKVYPPAQITTANLVDGYTLNWLHRASGAEVWAEGMPAATAFGTHEVRCYTPGTENYERTYSNVVNFIIKQIPEPSDFVFTGPSSWVYDGTPKTVTVKPKPNIMGMGAITIKYYIVYSNGTKTQLSGPPTVASPDGAHYEFWFDVAEGTEYTAKTDLPVILN